MATIVVFAMGTLRQNVGDRAWRAHARTAESAATHLAIDGNPTTIAGPTSDDRMAVIEAADLIKAVSKYSTPVTGGPDFTMDSAGATTTAGGCH